MAMALYSVRLRRSLLCLSSSVVHLRTLHSQSQSQSQSQSSSRRILLSNNLEADLDAQKSKTRRPSISFHLKWSRHYSLSTRPNDDQEIVPDSILFEGCDYNHWLITIDFPKDEDISDEHKVETYLRTAALVFGSVEEAKKRIYACSTSTYHGFQVECSEETSAKFQGLPGVVFILPDSYIDPINKEYGGDKYENGIITRRPPPGQYRQRNSDRPSQENYNSRGTPPQPVYGRPQLRPTQPNYGPPQSSPTPQSYGPPQTPSSQQFYGQPQGPAHQQSHGLPQGPASQQNFGTPSWAPPSHQNYGLPPSAPPSQQHYVPQPQVPFSQQNYGPPPQGPQSQQYYRPPPPPQGPQAQPHYRPLPPQNFPRVDNGYLGPRPSEGQGPQGGNFNPVLDGTQQQEADYKYASLEIDRFERFPV